MGLSQVLITSMVGVGTAINCRLKIAPTPIIMFLFLCQFLFDLWVEIALLEVLAVNFFF